MHAFLLHTAGESKNAGNRELPRSWLHDTCTLLWYIANSLFAYILLKSPRSRVLLQDLPVPKPVKQLAVFTQNEM